MRFRVQSHHFASEQDVTVQMQGMGFNGSVSAQMTKAEAAALPVGEVVEATFAPVEAEE